MSDDLYVVNSRPPLSGYSTTLKNASVTAGAGVGDGTTTVTNAGTAVQLSATSTPVKRLVIQAHESNTGTITIGASDVVAALNGRKGWALYPTNAQEFYVNNLNLIYIDSTVSGDKVNYYFEIT